MRKGVFKKIWQEVEKIPRGKVATYGQIGKKLEIDPRVVGWALHANREPKVPCHRVVNRFGGLAPGYIFGGWQKQKERLLKEGVKFISLKQVDLKKSGWRG